MQLLVVNDTQTRNKKILRFQFQFDQKASRSNLYGSICCSLLCSNVVRLGDAAAGTANNLHERFQ